MSINPESKTKLNNSKIDTNENDRILEKETEIPKYLGNVCLDLRETWDEESRSDVPICSPRSDFLFDFPIEPIPTNFPNINDLEVPIIREIGVKESIRVLGNFFKCTDYQHNHLHFWFLDVMTDCLWRTQDEFRFPINTQKRVLEWVLYMFNILRDPLINFSRKKFFRAFTEIVLVVGEIIDEEQEELPPPEMVFRLITDEERKEKEKSENVEEEQEQISLGRSWSSSGKKSKSSGTFSKFKEKLTGAQSFIEIQKEAVGVDRDILRSKLPTKTYSYNEYKFSSSSTYTMTTELSKKTSKLSSSVKSGKDEIPERFEPYVESKHSLSLISPITGKKVKNPPSSIDSQSVNVKAADAKALESYENINGEDVKDEAEEEEEIHVIELKDKFEIVTESEFSRTPKEEDSCPKGLFKSENLGEEEEQVFKDYSANAGANSPASPPEPDEDVAEEEELDDEFYMKRLIFRLLWEQRLKDMDDSEKGWLPTKSETTQAVSDDSSFEDVEEEEEDSDIENKEEWFKFINEQKKELSERYKRKLFNFVVIWAVIDFVFYYFYNKFQFSLIVHAFKATPVIITQRLNNMWRIPKINKEEAVIPRDEKPKEKKPAKEKKEKKKKDSKPKKDKAKGKKEKGKAKKEGKKDKGPKLTKEELKELERQKKEEERLEEEKLMMLEKELEQKRFMFPLQDGGTDEFFQSIFENWVKVDLDKVLGKGKKDKGKGKKK